MFHQDIVTAVYFAVSLALELGPDIIQETHLQEHEYSCLSQTSYRSFDIEAVGELRDRDVRNYPMRTLLCPPEVDVKFTESVSN